VLTSIVIFVLVYFAIAGRRLGILPVGRPAAGLFGAVACVLFRVLTPAQAYASIDGDTLVLLLAMMILAAHLDYAGFFEWGAAMALRYARTPGRLLTFVVFGAGITSAFLVNDSVCLMMTPLVVRLIRRGRLGPTLFLMALATSANIGSVMTLVGNPQNMLVGSMSHLSFRHFFVLMAPVGLLALILNRFLLPLFYPLRPVAPASAARQAEWLDTPFDDADELPADFRHTIIPKVKRGLLLKCFVCLAVAVVGFFAGFNVAWTALTAATLLLCIAGWEPRQAFNKVDWPLLLFFAGLFIVVGGLRQSGVVERLFEALHPTLGADPRHQAWAFSFVTLLGSNLVSNVPYVLVAGEWVPGLVRPETGWLLLAMASTFAGNLTLIGSVANILVVEGGRDATSIGFRQYLRYGVVITLLTTLLGTAWILWFS
jgi:Na+/H+ antiporter NhaD/arsenite permease-like protein